MRHHLAYRLLRCRPFLSGCHFVSREVAAVFVARIAPRPGGEASAGILPTAAREFQWKPCSQSSRRNRLRRWLRERNPDPTANAFGTVILVTDPAAQARQNLISGE